LSKTKKFKIIIVIISISLIQGLQFSVSPVLDQIQSHFPGVNVSLVQMLVTAPALLAVIAALISGWLVVKISKKKLLLFGSLAAGIAGFLPFLSDSFGLLFFSRTFYGVGFGLACTLNTVIVAEFFEGNERVTAMGIQGASIGAGMVVVTTLSGRLGAYGFQFSYFVNIIGFISMIVIALLLPDTGKARVTDTEKIQLNKEVFKVSFLGLLELLFLISFTTNIAMHISGALAGDTTVSGTLTGIFSGSQIVIGLVLGYVTKVTGKYTLPAAMLSFSAGGIILVFFPSNYALLMIGAVFCGFSQGMFVQQALNDVSNAVKPVSTAMASACFTCAACLGQLISPTVLNTASSVIFGDVTTAYVFLIAATGMAAAAAMVIVMKVRKNRIGRFAEIQ
jgi:MFS family permease